MSEGRDRRKHRRIAVTWTVEASSGSAPTHSVEIVNVSESGLGIVSLTPMKAGTRYHFRFPAWTARPLEGIVRWTEVGEVQTYAGIEFQNLDDAQTTELRFLIARYDKEDWGREPRP